MIDKTVGLIGAGAIGSVVAELAAAAGMRVIISNARGPASLERQVSELGPLVRAATPDEAARSADIVALALPLLSYALLPADALAGKIVIDMTNYYPFPGAQIAALDSGEVTSSEFIQRQFPAARIVKALHNVDARHLLINAQRSAGGEPTALPMAGDDAAAKQAIGDFLAAIGYQAVDVGSLAESWRIEPGAPIYVWPYAPPVPEGLTMEDAEALFLSTAGPRVSVSEVRDLTFKAVRPSPPGGSINDLPPVMLAMIHRRFAQSG